jgi:Clp amino terminal domain, pathogenicity island component
MFERFTDRARRVVVLAQEEARLLNHNYIGTEHILLGLIHEGEGVAAEALERMGVSLQAVRAQVEEIIGQGQSGPTGHIPFTPRAKKVLELSLREALQLGHDYIGSEHILLGLIREGDGVAAQVLTRLGADLGRVRQQVTEILTVRGERPSPRVFGSAAPPLAVVRARERGAGPPKLVRIVPIGQEVEIAKGQRLVLLSLEIWSDWTDLRVGLVGAERLPPSLGSARDDAWTLADNLGTSYECLGTRVEGDDRFQVHQATFVPSPPPEAAALTLTLLAAKARHEIQVAVELR